jgi:hypothetical protein
VWLKFLSFGRGYSTFVHQISYPFTEGGGAELDMIRTSRHIIGHEV